MKYKALLSTCVLALGLSSPVLSQSPSVMTTQTQPAINIDLDAILSRDDVREAIGRIAEDYFTRNPDAVVRIIENAQEFRQREQTRLMSENLAQFEVEILSIEHGIVLGNPDGDVTIVEFHDFNCGFCKVAVEHLEDLKARDQNVRVLAVDMPVLGPGSREAALVGLAAQRQLDAEKMSAFYLRMYDLPGQIDGEAAISVAVSLGADETRLRRDTEDPRLAGLIDYNLMLARNVGITGTPSFIVGGEVVVGAVGVEPLQRAVDNTRSCGRATC